MRDLSTQILLEILRLKMTNKLPNPRDLVLAEEVKVSNGIKGHQHREKNQLKRKYFQIHDLEEFD